MEDSSAQLSIFIASGVAVAFALVWLGVQTYFGFRYARAGDDAPVDKKAVIVWALSIAGAFTGPCVVLFAMAGIAGGAWLLTRQPSERTRAAALGALSGGAILLVMVLAMVAVMAIGGSLG